MILLQTAAIFRDAYRELNARKLFWLALILSGAVVLSFLLVSFEDGYLKLFIWKTPLALSAMGVTPATFYKLIFLEYGVKLWLAWIATIIAIVTTAGIIPEFVSGGAIDLALSKPIGRVRLFLTKYVAALLFVALQVTVFATLSFLVLGLRGATWEPGIFLAIPLMIIFFSYLYCISALVGLLTRSTIAAMILTLLFWFFLFILNNSDTILFTFKANNEQILKNEQQRVVMLEQARDEPDRPDEPGDGGLKGAFLGAMTSGFDQQKLDRAIERRDATRKDVEALERWHGRIIAVKTVFPKTSETIDLLQRALIELAQLEQFSDAMSDSGEPPPERVVVDDDGEETTEVYLDEDDQRAVSQAQLHEFRARSILWIVGTSLGFEAVILGLCCWIFARRDY